MASLFRVEEKGRGGGAENVLVHRDRDVETNFKWKIGVEIDDASVKQGCILFRD